MTTPDMHAFAQYIPGFEFLQNLTRQAAAGHAPGTQSGVPGMPPMSHWVAPTFDVEELDKRIQDLRAVHFWLDQNTKALAATIQALEVQKMTLATLKGMNVSLQDMAEAFKIKPEQAEPEPASAPEPAPKTVSAEASSAEPESTPPPVDPMQWWNALTHQFQTIATGAMRDMAEHASRTAASSAAQTDEPKVKKAAATKTKASRARTSGAKAAGASATRRPAASSRSSTKARTR